MLKVYQACLFSLLIGFSGVLSAQPLLLGQPLPYLSLADNDGGYLDGTAWNTESLKGKVRLLMYIDPDVKDINQSLNARLKAENYPKDRFQSVVVINWEATWLPGFILDGALADKQKLYPDTLYLKDLTKKLVNEWELADNAYSILLLDENSVIQAWLVGEISDYDQQQALIDLIWKTLGQ